MSNFKSSLGSFINKEYSSGLINKLGLSIFSHNEAKLFEQTHLNFKSVSSSFPVNPSSLDKLASILISSP
jgi:hypothetical protein